MAVGFPFIRCIPFFSVDTNVLYKNDNALHMQLWETTLSYAPMMVPQLLACFPHMVEIIERSFDHLQVSFLSFKGVDVLIMNNLYMCVLRFTETCCVINTLRDIQMTICSRKV